MKLEEYMREIWLMKNQYGQEEGLYPLINMLLREGDNTKHLSIRDVHNARLADDCPERVLLMGAGSFPDIAILDERFERIESKKIEIEFKNIQPEELEEKENIKKEIEKEIGKEIEENRKRIYGCVEAKPFVKKNDELIKIELLPQNAFNINRDVKEKKFIAMNNNEKIKLGKNDDVNQLLGEILYYGKVLYTNGIRWYFIELKTADYNNKKNITNMENDDNIKQVTKLREGLETKVVKVTEQKEAIYVKLPEKINDITVTIDCTEIGNLTDLYNKIFDDKKKNINAIWRFISQEDLQEWTRLKTNLSRINWIRVNDHKLFI